MRDIAFAQRSNAVGVTFKGSKCQVFGRDMWREFVRRYLSGMEGAWTLTCLMAVATDDGVYNVPNMSRT